MKPGFVLCFATLLPFLTADSHAQMHYPSSFQDEIDPHLRQIGTDARDIIVLIHGWNPPDAFRGMRVAENAYYEGPEWLSFRNAIFQRLSGTAWKLVLYHWEQDANTGLMDFDPLNGAIVQDAIRNATDAAGLALLHGKYLAQKLNEQAPNLRRAHFIAHSAGAWAARQAALVLLSVNPYMVVQVTLCDAYVPGAVAAPYSPCGYLCETPLTSARIEDLAWCEQADRVYRLDHYYSDGLHDLTKISGATEETFAWRAKDIGGQRVDYDSCYDTHSGPISFLSDTVLASAAGPSDCLSRVATHYGFDFAAQGWFRSLASRAVLFPSITQHPQDTSAPAGQSITLRVQAEGVIGYAWFKDGSAIASSEYTSDGPTLTFRASTILAGKYAVKVNNQYGFLFSDAAVVSAYSAPEKLDRWFRW
jgi:hypothetical protein